MKVSNIPLTFFEILSFEPFENDLSLSTITSVYQLIGWKQFNQFSVGKGLLKVDPPDCKNILMSTSVLPKASVDIDADDGNLGVSNYDYDQCSNSASHDNNDDDEKNDDEENYDNDNDENDGDDKDDGNLGN